MRDKRAEGHRGRRRITIPNPQSPIPKPQCPITSAILKAVTELATEH